MPRFRRAGRVCLINAGTKHPSEVVTFTPCETAHLGEDYMSASAKPAEKVLKSFLAAVLAVSFCPLMPSRAQAQESSGGGRLN